jgi:hypothetical protein
MDGVRLNQASPSILERGTSWSLLNRAAARSCGGGSA